MKKPLLVIATLLLGTAIGFFIGREQMRQEIHGKLTSFQKSFSITTKETPEDHSTKMLFLIAKDIEKQVREQEKIAAEQRKKQDEILRKKHEEQKKVEEARRKKQQKQQQITQMKKVIKISQQKVSELKQALSNASKQKKQYFSDVKNRKKIKISTKYTLHGEYLKRPSVMISIKNNSKTVISGGHIFLSLVDPKRTTPYEEGELRFNIQGGLEVGESKQKLIYTLSGFDKRWKVSGVDPNDLILKNRKVGFYDAKGNKIWYSDWDKENEDVYSKGIEGYKKMKKMLEEYEERLKKLQEQ
ncbi:hypothetical protein [Candidatus Uabimicrobium amorphum]|uniref:Uncharacterized protein n=1 Tax=Uabimicrobium amorphum TaxID=2596890 RepID=A0A5S9ISW8_UABAM|nr:hypothetical protein [Candidatus Uabimicrobium amorphum]BBM86812.1 hypothetical protein UABAM_05200 [Candidatus Uabimicrobium amorphum]